MTGEPRRSPMRGRLAWSAAAVAALLAWAAIAPAAHAQFPFSPTQPSPAQPAPAQPQVGASDQRANLARQAKADLEGQGFKVYELGFIPGEGNKLPVWYADVGANYSQPNGGRMLNMAFSVWAILHRIGAKEPPQTMLVNGQVWTKYVLILGAPLGGYDRLLTSLRTAGSDADKKKVVNAFLETISFRVYDMEKRQLVDQKDFINKNFTQ